MERKKFGVAVTPEIVDELDELVEECADLGAISLRPFSQHTCSPILISHKKVRPAPITSRASPSRKPTDPFVKRGDVYSKYLGRFLKNHTAW